jgi:hypothetical protein
MHFDAKNLTKTGESYRRWRCRIPEQTLRFGLIVKDRLKAGFFMP